MSEDQREFGGPYVQPLETDWGPPTVLCVGASDAEAAAVRDGLEKHRDDLSTRLAAGVGAASDGLEDLDCVVSRYDLGDGTGVDLLDSVRAVDRGLPVLILAEAGSEATAAEAVNAGADGYVPADADEPYARVADRVTEVVDCYRSRREHAEATRLLRQLTEYTRDALWMFSADWTELLFINSAYEDIWGDSMADIVENPQIFLEGVHPDDQATVVDGMETLSSGESDQIEFRVNPEEDYERWVSVQAEPALDEAGEIEHIAGYSRDISRRKHREQALQEYKEELERSNESLREFAYIASHDLQEPLRMVSSYVDLLEQEYGDQLEGDAAEYMEYASQGARRMKQMINSLLEYSRVHSQADEMTPVDAAAVFEGTRQDLELLIDDHDAEVVVGDLPTVEADPDQLGQLFQNLVKNAIVHADDGSPPRVEVTATDRGDGWEFAVADDGPGIPEGQEDDIFEIFNQGGAGADADSTGIGLAVAKRIVQRHGGDIWAESAPDEGATFKFTVPGAEGN